MLKRSIETQQLLEQMKNEVAAELGIEISPDMTTRDAGKIGGKVTQRLVELGEIKLAEMNTQQPQNSFKQFNQQHGQQTTNILKNYSKQHNQIH